MLLHSYCILEETFRGIRFVFQHTIIVKLNQKSIAFYLPIMNSIWRNGDILNMHDSGYFAISHVVGSSKHKGNQSWKRYWSACTNRPFPKKCQILNCSNPAQVGAHIYIKYLHQIFILPTCQKCNKNEDTQYNGRKDCWTRIKKNATAVRVERHERTYEEKLWNPIKDAFVIFQFKTFYEIEIPKLEMLYCDFYACADSPISHRPSFRILPLDGKWEYAIWEWKNVWYKPGYLFLINICKI